MRVFIYQSEKDADVSGFSVQSEGNDLPRDFGPWLPVGNAELEDAIVIAGGDDDPGTVEAAILRDGHFLVRRRSRFQFPGRS